MASTRKGGRRGPRKGALTTQAAGAPRRPAKRRPLADYRVLETLRSGLVGPVRAAVYRPTGRELAVETVPDRFRTYPAFVAALAASGPVASQLRHPRVAVPYEVVSGSRSLHVVTELVRGKPLSAAQDVPPPLRVLDAVLEGLDAIHADGMAHGWVTPDTVVLDETGEAHLVEFGLSQAVCAAEGRDCTPAADLVAAAALGLHLLGSSSRRQRRASDHRRALRALQQVIEAGGAHPTMPTASAIRAAIAPRGAQAGGAEGAHLPRRLVRRASLAAAAVAVGVAAGLTVAAAMGAQPATPALSLTAQPRLTSSPAQGGCGTTFSFTATGPVRGAGTLTYQWLRSDGTAGPVRHLQVGRNDASFRITNAWSLRSPATGPITMTLQVISPSHVNVSRSVVATCT